MDHNRSFGASGWGVKWVGTRQAYNEVRNDLNAKGINSISRYLGDN